LEQQQATSISVPAEDGDDDEEAVCEEISSGFGPRVASSMQGKSQCKFPEEKNRESCIVFILVGWVSGVQLCSELMYMASREDNLWIYKEKIIWQFGSQE